MPAVMTQNQLNDSIAAAAREAEKIKQQGPIGQCDPAEDQALGLCLS